MIFRCDFNILFLFNISIIFLLLVILQVINIIPVTAHAVNEFDEENSNRLVISISESFNSSILYLSVSQNKDGDWYDHDKSRTANIAKVLKYIVSINQDSTLPLELLENAELFFEYENVQKSGHYSG